MKKKILYVITQGELGGAQRYVFDLATNLANDFDITVAVGEPKGRKELQEKLRVWNMEHGAWSIKTVELKHLKRKISPWHDMLAIFELARLYKKLKPDIVHLNSSKAGIIGSVAKLFMKLDSSWSLPPHTRGWNDKIKVIYTVHGWVFNESLGKIKKNFYRWLERTTAMLKYKIVVLSNNDCEAGIKLGIQKEKLIIIPLGMHQQKLINKEKAKKEIVKLLNGCMDDNSVWIGSIANLYHTKGLDLLIEAARLLNSKKQIINNKFLIIGDGSERKKLENLVVKNKLQNYVYLIGSIENAAEYLPAFDLFVLPSRKEGLPYTILEAMAAGIPIVTTNVGGIPSLINDDNGILVEPENINKLADSILWALTNLEEMKKRAESALYKVKEFSIEKMLEETKKMYGDFK